MRLMGIESSCDETAVAVVDIDQNKIAVVCSEISSSMGIQKQYGGVVPEVAARQHAEVIHILIDKALQSTASGDGSDIDLIAVTRGPGLKTSLLVGITAAETLGLLWNKPVIGVNHLEGHFLAPLINHEIYPPQESDFPIIILTASGGHTQIVLMKIFGKYEIIGQSIDDAAGEAFDKVAKMMNLGYPGGPIIDRLAKNGDPTKFDLPKPLLNSGDYRFSFSGLKTSVKYVIRDLKTDQLSITQKQDIAASFQRAIVDVLAIKTMQAAEQYEARTLFVSGGVGANSELRQIMVHGAKELGIKPVLIDRRYSGDNAVMIAVAGYFQYMREGVQREIKVDPKLGITRNF